MKITELQKTLDELEQFLDLPKLMPPLTWTTHQRMLEASRLAERAAGHAAPGSRLDSRGRSRKLLAAAHSIAAAIIELEIEKA